MVAPVPHRLVPTRFMPLVGHQGANQAPGQIMHSQAHRSRGRLLPPQRGDRVERIRRVLSTIDLGVIVVMTHEQQEALLTCQREFEVLKAEMNVSQDADTTSRPGEIAVRVNPQEGSTGREQRVNVCTPCWKTHTTTFVLLRQDVALHVLLRSDPQIRHRIRTAR